MPKAQLTRDKIHHDTYNNKTDHADDGGLTTLSEAAEIAASQQQRQQEEYRDQHHPLAFFDITPYHHEQKSNHSTFNNERFKRQLPPYYYHQLQQQEAAEAAESKEAEANNNKKEAESIADNLKHNDLDDGSYYSSDDIEAIIKRKYPSASDQVIKLVIDMLLRDVAFFSSKVMGDRFDNAKLVIAARRKPVVQDSNKKQ